jgi:hypothetical protein
MEEDSLGGHHRRRRGARHPQFFREKSRRHTQKIRQQLRTLIQVRTEKELSRKYFCVSSQAFIVFERCSDVSLGTKATC